MTLHRARSDLEKLWAEHNAKLKKRDEVKQRVMSEDRVEKGAEEERSQAAAEATLWGLMAQAGSGKKK